MSSIQIVVLVAACSLVSSISTALVLVFLTRRALAREIDRQLEKGLEYLYGQVDAAKPADQTAAADTAE
jgi:hypothetical protein